MDDTQYSGRSGKKILVLLLIIVGLAATASGNADGLFAVAAGIVIGIF